MYQGKNFLFFSTCRMGLFIFAVLVLTACSETEQKLQQITLGAPNSALSSIIWLANELNYFEQQNIEVNLKLYSSGKEALSALLANDVDLAATAETPFVVALFKTKSLRLFASIGQSNNEVHILARRDHGINSPSDLKGKIIATQKGSAVHFFLSSFLLHHQLDPESLTIQFMRSDDLPIALIKGDIDAFSMREPFLTQATSSIGVDKVITFSVPGLYTKTYNLVGHNTIIKNKPDAVRKILLSLHKASQFADRYPQRAIEIVAKRFSLPVKQISDNWLNMRLGISLNQGLLYTLQEEMQWAIDTGQIALDNVENGRLPNILRYIDPSPLRMAIPNAVGLIGARNDLDQN